MLLLTLLPNLNNDEDDAALDSSLARFALVSVDDVKSRLFVVKRPPVVVVVAVDAASEANGVDGCLLAPSENCVALTLGMDDDLVMPSVVVPFVAKPLVAMVDDEDDEDGLAGPLVVVVVWLWSG